MTARPASARAFDRSIHTTPTATSPLQRAEKDSLGSLFVPADVYWGVHTARALENFAISGRPVSAYPDLVYAFACVKQAAARANADVGSLSRDRASLIDAACEEMKHGAFLDQFVVDIIQGGAGASTNMNANEVIANRALELGGYHKGQYEFLDPWDDVNRSQSTHDTYPTALKLALAFALNRFLVAHNDLRRAFGRKSRDFRGILKAGRTQLQDAVPMTLAQEFEGFAVTLRDDYESLRNVVPMLYQINLGATVVGTGITADPRYAAVARKHLSEIVGVELRTATHPVEATTDICAFLQVSGGLKRCAVKQSKICNDLRLLSSGPQAGFGEINLPPRQAGSSIMPGKVNPVICEVVNGIAFFVIGADLVVTLASEAGQLQLNAFEPVIAHALLESLKCLTAGVITLRTNCVEGITANEAHLSEQMSSFAGVITAFTPYIGYAPAAALAKQALTRKTDVAALIVESGLMSREDVQLLMEPARLAGEDRSMPPLSGRRGHTARQQSDRE